MFSKSFPKWTLKVIFSIFISTPLIKSYEMDLNTDYSIEWEFTPNGQSVMFQAVVKTMGFVGLGISKPGQAIHTDLIIGGFNEDLDDGYYYSDYWKATDASTPAIDTSQDWLMSLCWENDTHTIMMHHRSLNTEDAVHDILIDEEVIDLVFVYGADDNLDFGSATWGSISINLLNPEIVTGSTTAATTNSPTTPSTEFTSNSPTTPPTEFTSSSPTTPSTEFTSSSPTTPSTEFISSSPTTPSTASTTQLTTKTTSSETSTTPITISTLLTTNNEEITTLLPNISTSTSSTTTTEVSVTMATQTTFTKEPIITTTKSYSTGCLLQNTLNVTLMFTLMIYLTY